MTKARRGKNIIMIVFSIFFALGVAEIFVRVLDVPPKMLPRLDTRTFRLSKNPILRFEFIPNYTSEEGSFGFGMENFVINKEGFRDRNYPVKKLQNTTRIIVIGDSITAGNNVHQLDEIYPKRLEVMLNENTERNYEVLSMGVGGYDTYREAESLRVKGMKYDPDVVIVGFCLNDFKAGEDGGLFRYLTQNEFEDNDRIIPSTAFIRNQLFYYLLSKSRLLFILYHRIQSQLHDMNVYEYYNEKKFVRENPVENGFALLSELQEKHGFEVYVAVIPYFENPMSKNRENTAYHDVFKLLKKYPSFNAIDLLEGLERQSPDGSLITPDGVHPSPEGHELLAKLIYSEIAK